MQINQNSDLLTYDMTADEVVASQQFSHLQKAYLQNERVAVMQDLINLKPDEMTEAGKETYWQREAYLRGQLDILTLLLRQSASHEQEQASSI